MMRLILISLLTLCSFAASAGIIASSTRVVFREGQTQQSLMVVNTNPWPIVVQTWVDEGDVTVLPGRVKTPFVAVPALFRLQPRAMQGLRLIYNRASLPADRESVFWLNLYEIPPTQAEQPAQAQSVVLTMNTQMKVFWRPASLTAPETAAEKLRFYRDGDAIVCENPTPYYVSFAALSVTTHDTRRAVEQLPDMMSPPLSTKRYPLAAGKPLTMALSVNAVVIDDNGNHAVRQYPLHAKK